MIATVIYWEFTTQQGLWLNALHILTDLIFTVTLEGSCY